MKRYDCDGEEFTEPYMTECENGNFVLYSDAEKLEERVKELEEEKDKSSFLNQIRTDFEVLYSQSNPDECVCLQDVRDILDHWEKKV